MNGKWEDTWEPTPFSTIPKAFWWSMVTITTVGYGDSFPTTWLGHVIAVLLMLFSMVLMSLPVGVIGSNFSQVWEEMEASNKNERETRQKELGIIKLSMQRHEPYET